MRSILNRQQIRAYDRLATERFKIPSLLLMENAGRGAADVIRNLILEADVPRPRICIVCGTGNNGGDGFVVARHLTNDAAISVILAGDVARITGDARVNFDALLACGISPKIFAANNEAALTREIQRAHCIVDALFGTGLDRDIAGGPAQLITAINVAPGKRISLDLPSGLDADHGTVLGHAVRADHTITFAHAKPGLYTPQGKMHAGLLYTVALGTPDTQLLAETGVTAEIIDPSLFIPLLQPRAAATYKHRAGDVLIVAGSPGKTGAAKLVAEATLRSGAGLATVCSWSDGLPAFEKEVMEIMLAPLKSDAVQVSLSAAMEKRSAIAIGPGLGLNAAAGEAVAYVLEHAKVPLVIDADALTHLAEDLSVLKACKAPKILTPHAGELARLLRVSSGEIEADRFGFVRRAAAETDSIVILKGAHTLIAAPDGIIYVSAAANPVLATAGSGDVLAGIIAALAVHMPPVKAAAAGVFFHAAAADLWTERTQSDRGMLAGDIARLIPEIIGRLTTDSPEKTVH